MSEDSSPASPFETGLRMMGAQQQLAARSLLNMIEMITSTSQSYARETSSFTRETFDLMKEAANTRDPAALAELQKRWAHTCVKYGQDQTRLAMNFVEQYGKRAIDCAAETPDSTPKD